MKTKLNTENSELIFVILFDFSRTSYKALDYLIKLAQVVEGSIDIFYVNSPSDLIDKESHFVDLKLLREEKEKIERKLISIVEMVDLEGVSVSFSTSFGVVEEELKQKFNNSSSKIAVLPKTKSGFMWKVTNYLMNKLTENILIIDECSEFNKSLNIAIGYNQPTFSKEALSFPSNYCLKSNTTLTTFEVKNVLDGIKKYISINDLNFICINLIRKKGSFFSKILRKNTSINEIVRNINIPVFIMGNKNR